MLLPFFSSCIRFYTPLKSGNKLDSATIQSEILAERYKAHTKSNYILINKKSINPEHYKKIKAWGLVKITKDSLYYISSIEGQYKNKWDNSKVRVIKSISLDDLESIEYRHLRGLSATLSLVAVAVSFYPVIFSLWASGI